MKIGLRTITSTTLILATLGFIPTTVHAQNSSFTCSKLTKDDLKQGGIVDITQIIAPNAYNCAFISADRSMVSIEIVPNVEHKVGISNIKGTKVNGWNLYAAQMATGCRAMIMAENEIIQIQSANCQTSADLARYIAQNKM